MDIVTTYTSPAERQKAWREAHKEELREYQREWQKNNREYVNAYQRSRYAEREDVRDFYRNQRYKTKYGITTADYDAMHDAQQGACAICRRSDARLGVDHDHATGEVRGLLCNACNRMLGWIETHNLIDSALAYLKR